MYIHVVWEYFCVCNKEGVWNPFIQPGETRLAILFWCYIWVEHYGRSASRPVVRAWREHVGRKLIQNREMLCVQRANPRAVCVFRPPRQGLLCVRDVVRSLQQWQQILNSVIRL